LANLRLVSASQNQQNRVLSKNNSSGHKGVSWDKSRGKWAASIYHASKCKHLGRFVNIEDAIAAYKVAAAKYHTHNPAATI
jgi:phage terminase large subunit-like protein